nr:hypothetical protein [Microcella alkalica]
MFNGAIISAAVSAVSVINATRRGPHDWRLALMWASWGISVAIAVGTIIEDQKNPGDPAFQLVDS